MKIDTVKGGFRPLTVTIQTREEALVLWHRLNISSNKFADKCVSMEHLNGVSDTQFDNDADNRVSTQLWAAIDSHIGREVVDND